MNKIERQAAFPHSMEAKGPKKNEKCFYSGRLRKSFGERAFVSLPV